MKQVLIISPAKLLAAMIFIFASGMMMFVSNETKADDHVGYKKIFLRAHCKADPSYVCRLSDPPDIELPF